MKSGLLRTDFHSARSSPFCSDTAMVHVRSLRAADTADTSDTTALPASSDVIDVTGKTDYAIGFA